MANIYFDGKVCTHRTSACFKYYAALAPRFVQQGHQVFVTPGIDEVLEGLSGPGIHILKRVTPKAPSWLPGGAWRKYASKCRAAWENWVTRKKAKTAKTLANPNVFFSFFFELPPDKSMPTVTMMHDLILEKLGDKWPSPDQPEMKQKRLQAMEHADQVLCISQKTREDLIEVYPHLEKKIATAYIGVDADFFATPTPPEVSDALLKELCLERPFLLYVGGRLNHKNFSLLLDAYSQGGFAEHLDLVCAGELPEAKEKQHVENMGLKNCVRFIRFPEEATLRTLYQRAQIFVYPSLYEGFGIPPLEAMAAGCPVIAAKGGSIPEVSGPGCKLVSTTDTQEMIQAIQTLLQPAEAAIYREAGAQQVKKYQWDTIAPQILDILLKTAHSPESCDIPQPFVKTGYELFRISKRSVPLGGD